jgi:Na+/melibiose symporter-like transporter
MTPFRIPFTNFVAVVAQYAILVTFMAALVLETDSLEKFGLSDFSLGAILSMINVCIIFLAFFIGWRRYIKERKEEKSVLSKRVKMEWAANFGKTKFLTTFQFTIHRNVPQSHCLCFYYTSLEQVVHIFAEISPM